MKPLYLTCLGLIFLFNLTSVAQAISCDITPKEMWVDNNIASWLTQNYITINCTWSCTSAWADLKDNTDTNTIAHIDLDNNSGYYTQNILLEETLPSGDYMLYTYCNNSHTNESYNESTTLKVNELTSKLVSTAPPMIYPNDVLDINLEFKISEEPIAAGATFKVYLAGIDIPLQGTPVFTANYWNIKAKVPESFTEYGMQDLKITATYKEQSISLTSYDYTEIKPLLNINIIDPPFFTPYRLTDTEDLEVTVEVLYKKDLIDKTHISGFKAKLDDREVKIEKVDYIDDDWILLINIPKRAPRETPYDLDIYVIYNELDAKSSKSIPIQFVIPFKGTLLNAKGSPASNIDIKLKSINFEEKIKTDNTGYYSAVIPPATYTIEILFPQFQAKLINVGLNSNDDSLELIQNIIQYDYFESKDTDSKKIVVLEVALPIESAHLNIPYSDTEFTDEDKIMVYQCKKWDYNERICDHDWEDIEATIDTKRNLISIYTESLSAFSIFEKKSINLDISLDKDRYYLEEKLNLNGKLLDEQLNAITDATITYSLGDISGKVTTDSNGDFSATFNAPKKEGTFDLNVEARKDPYLIKKTIGMTTYRKKSLTISTPSSPTVDLDIPSYITFTLSNTGQSAVSDITLSASEIPGGWYQLSSSKIDRLDVGERQEIEMKLLIPEDQCTDNQCMQQYTVTLNAKSDITATSSSFTLNIDGIAPKAQSETQVEETKADDSQVTGLSTGAWGSNILTIIVIFIAFISIILLAKKLNMLKSDTRNSLTPLIRNVKTEVLKTENSGEAPARISATEPATIKKDETQKKDLEDIIVNPFSGNE